MCQPTLETLNQIPVLTPSIRLQLPICHMDLFIVVGMVCGLGVAKFANLTSLNVGGKSLGRNFP